jgi:serine O-acetyltransferase
VVGAGAKVLGGFEVGDGARIGSNSVVLKPVPAGATAVGNPAHILDPSQPRESDVFSAYGVTRDMDDPLAHAVHELLGHVSETDRRFALLLEALAKAGIHPGEVEGLKDEFDAGKLSKLVD